MKAQVLTPETAEEVRRIAQEVFREQQPAILKTVEHEFRPLWAPQPMWPAGVEAALRGLTEAQTRTEERIAELAEAQRRTEQRIEELTEAQKRSEARLEGVEERLEGVEERLTRLEITVQELAEAQKRSEARLEGVEERLTRLEVTVQELAEAQKRTAQRVGELSEAQKRTDTQLGRISNVLGLDAEVEAQEILLYVLERKGYRVITPPAALDLDGEVDVAVQVEDTEGARFWVLTEAKFRARLKDLRRWADRLRSEGFVRRLEQQGVGRPYLFYLFGVRVYRPTEAEAQRLGLGVLDPDGERVAPTPIR